MRSGKTGHTHNFCNHSASCSKIKVIPSSLSLLQNVLISVQMTMFNRDCVIILFVDNLLLNIPTVTK